jgi:hypothetical protein
MSSLPYMEMEEVAALLGYKNRRAAIRAIKDELFELPFYTLAGRPVVNTAVIHKFFEEKTEEGLLAVELGEKS